MAYWNTDQLSSDHEDVDMDDVWMSDNETNDAIVRAKSAPRYDESDYLDYEITNRNDSILHRGFTQVPVRTKNGTVLPIQERRLQTLIRSDGKANKTLRTDTLCTRCACIDFKAVFEIDGATLPQCGLRFADIEVLETELRKSHCSMCILIVSMIDRGYGGRTIRTMSGVVYDRINHNLTESILSKAGDEQADSSGAPWKGSLMALSGSSLKDVYDYIEMEDDSVVIGLEYQNDWAVQDSLYDRGVLVWKSDGDDPKEPLKDISVYISDQLYKQIASIIDDCTHHHSVCGSQKMSFPDAAKVIDCSTREIILLKQEMRYIALSYVWGVGRQPPNVDLGDILPDPLPRTIEDSLEICRKLGFKYLWVDKYCIKQYHSSDKMKQIGQMGNIYSRATATICAIGKDDEAAISGVSTRRFISSSVTVEGGSLHLYGDGISLDLRRSVWKQRAWTLQEVMLSRLCLFFTDEGVMVTCKTSTSMEDTASSVTFRKSKNLDREMLMFGRAQDHVSGPASEIVRYELLQAEYLKRQLGYDSDGLNAFRGLLSQMEAPSYWGLPTLWDDRAVIQTDNVRTRFLEALFWVAGSAGRRRQWKEAPTWSWVSRTNQIRARDYRNMSFGGEILFEADLSVVQNDSTEIELDNLFSNRRTGVIPEQSKFLRIHSIMANWSKKDFLREKLSVNVEVEQSWLQACILGVEGSIIFDEGEVYDDCKEIETTWLGWSEFEDKYPEKGQAVLLIVKIWEKYWILSRWLAVIELADGSYERKGTITVLCHYSSSDEAVKKLADIAKESLLLG